MSLLLRVGINPAKGEGMTLQSHDHKMISVGRDHSLENIALDAMILYKRS